MAQTLSGRNLRWYFQGSVVGMGRVTMLKPDLQIGLDAVKECGTPTVLEYVPKVPETTINLGYNLISKYQLAAAMGQVLGGTDASLGSTAAPGAIVNVGEVPSIPQQFDIVERRIKPGTEGTTGEIVNGYSIYQNVAVEKESWDQEVDKLVGVDISGKCKAPRDYENINGISFEKFVPNGVLTAFVTAHKPVQGKDGLNTIRVEAPIGTTLREGTGADYTTASTSSSMTITFAVAPASSTANQVLAIYAW